MSNQLISLKLNLYPKKVAQFFGLIVLTLLFCNIIVLFSTYILGYGRLLGILPLFNMMRESNIPSTYASFALLFCCLLLAIIAIAKHKEKNRYARHWKYLSLIFLYLSFDEAASIHELTDPLIKQVIVTTGLFNFAWVILGITLVTIFVISYRKFILSLPLKTRALFIKAGITFVSGAIGMEMIGGWYSELHGHENWIYSTLVTIEETLEKLGIVIFIYALLDYISSYLNLIEIHIFNKSPLEKLQEQEAQLNNVLK